MKTKPVKRPQILALICAFVVLTFVSCEKEEIHAIAEPDAGGNISFTIEKVKNPTQDQKDAYNKIEKAMNDAIAEYNKHGNFTKKLKVKYKPSVKTAHATTGGNSITFGKNRTYMCKATAMHEIAHTLGVGGSKWQKLVDVKKKLYTGEEGKKKYKELKGNQNTVLKADKKHFWGYGLGKPSQKDFQQHVKLMVAIKKDLNAVKN
ncbi:MAG: hypothetical protein MI922_28965 [Bacteroidales bacterium]|nr:hypothetical protein [Bacteroidales bacterium]